MTSEISFNNFSLRYSPSANWALSQLTFDVPKGSCCAVLGAVSAGKTTLLQGISGILGKHHATVETQGTFTLAGREGTSISREVLFPETGLALQDPYVMISGIHDTVETEIAFTLQNLGIEPDIIRSRVQDTLTKFNLQELARRNPRNLSGGEVQRVALASILITQPRVLLLDEPRNALDSHGQETLARILHSLHGNTTVLFSDYDIDLAVAVADYIVVLDQGKSIYQGSKKGFLARFEQFTSVLISDSWQKTLPRFMQDARTPANVRIRKVFGVTDAQA